MRYGGTNCGINMIVDPDFLNLCLGAGNFDKSAGGVARQVVFLDGIAFIKIKT